MTVGTGLLTTNAGGHVVLRRVRVRVVSGPDQGAEALLDGGTLILGSHQDTDLRVHQKSVSRFHLEMGLLADGVRLRDLNSTNGTFVNGVRIESVVVRPACEIRIGKVRIQLVPADLAAPDAAPDITQFGALVGETPRIRQAFGLLKTASRSDVGVLIEGETGTGKTAAARALHQASSRNSGPMNVFDALAPRGALSEFIERSRGGTLLFENIDAAARTVMDSLQAHLERRDRGELDFRLIATAKTDVRTLVQEGAFARGLYFATAGVRIELPPLRERREDIPLILRTLAKRFSLSAAVDGPELALLGTTPLHGNVRELVRLLEHTASRLRPSAQSDVKPLPVEDDELADLPFKQAKEQLVDAFERRYVRTLLERHDGNVSRAAAEAGLDRNYLARLAKKHTLR